MPYEFYSSPSCSDNSFADDLLTPPVFPFDQDVRTRLLDEIQRGVVLENHHIIHEAQRRYQFHTIGLSNDWAPGSLDARDRPVGIDANHHNLPHGGRLAQDFEMSRMKQIKAPICEDDLLSLDSVVAKHRTDVFQGDCLVAQRLVPKGINHLIETNRRGAKACNHKRRGQIGQTDSVFYGETVCHSESER